MGWRAVGLPAARRIPALPPRGPTGWRWQAGTAQRPAGSSARPVALPGGRKGMWQASIMWHQPNMLILCR